MQTHEDGYGHPSARKEFIGTKGWTRAPFAEQGGERPVEGKDILVVTGSNLGNAETVTRTVRR